MIYFSKSEKIRKIGKILDKNENHLQINGGNILIYYF